MQIQQTDVISLLQQYHENLRFSQYCCWRLKSSGMCQCVIGFSIFWRVIVPSSLGSGSPSRVVVLKEATMIPVLSLIYCEQFICHNHTVKHLISHLCDQCQTIINISFISISFNSADNGRNTTVTCYILQVLPDYNANTVLPCTNICSCVFVGWDMVKCLVCCCHVSLRIHTEHDLACQ